METRTDEIADGIFRLSTFVPEIAAPAGFTFNQFFVVGDEALLFHTGPRALFPSVSAAAARVAPFERLRWITFGHVEADECGSMNLWLSMAPHAQVAHNAIGCLVSLNDLCDRTPQPLNDGDVIDIGGKRLRLLETPHVPHAWEAQLLHEETTATLLCGDLFTRIGDIGPVTRDDLIPAALEAEDLFHASSLHPSTGDTLRRLASLEPDRLALMHGASFEGDCGDALRRLARAYDGLAHAGA